MQCWGGAGVVIGFIQPMAGHFTQQQQPLLQARCIQTKFLTLSQPFDNLGCKECSYAPSPIPNPTYHPPPPPSSYFHP